MTEAKKLQQKEFFQYVADGKIDEVKKVLNGEVEVELEPVEEKEDDTQEQEEQDLHKIGRFTTIRLAVNKQNMEMLKLLLENDGAKKHINYCHKAIGSVLMEAVWNESAEFVSVLMDAGADATLNGEHVKHVVKGSSGNAFVDSAALEDLTIFDMFVARGVDPIKTVAVDGKNILMHAVHANNLPGVRRFSKVGLDINARTIPTEDEISRTQELHTIAKDSTEFDSDKEGTTALGFIDLYGQDDAKEIFRILVDNGADVNKSKAASPILFEAMSHEDEDMVEYLLDLGADPNVRNTDGLTALSKAVVFNTPFVVKKLLKAGANPYLTHPNGKTSYEFLKGRTWDKKEIENLLNTLSTVSAPVQ